VATSPARPARPRPRRTSQKAIAERAGQISELLAETYPGTAKQLCALKHRGPFQLLVATILSAQCTDERVNLVTPALFRRYPGPRQLAAADRDEVEELIRSTGFFRSKTSHLIGMARGLLDGFGPKPSDFPHSLQDLTSLPGVGRKTANVVRSVALGLPGLPVDTHVLRLSRRLGLTQATDPVKVETDLCALFPEQEWGAISVRLILHGRRVCLARRPRCGDCVLAPICPSAYLGSAVLPSTGPRRLQTPKAPKAEKDANLVRVVTSRLSSR
jgi:endonuclease-3